MNIKIKVFVITAFFLLLISSVDSIKAQTTLVAGDIAFSGHISTFDPAIQPDEFSFVLLRNITSGTVINFTDNGWLSTGVFRTGETTVTWTATSALSAGQEIRIAGTTAFLASGAGSPGTVTGTSLNLSSGGDQILAYQGTSASPTFITGIHMNVYTISFGDTVDTTAAAWDSTVNNSNSSALPPGLTTGTNAIWIGTFQTPASEQDNARFTCGTGNIATAASARSSLNNQANWTKTNTNPPGFTLPTGCPYLVVLAANVSLSGKVIRANGTGISKATLTLTDNSGLSRTVKTNSFGFYQFDDLESGSTYTLTVNSKQFQFANPTRIISIDDNLGGVDFEALP